MKAKHLLWATGVLLLAAGLWFGRAAWRAHQQLVTLNVRNAPLTDVLHAIERQTWTKPEPNSTGRTGSGHAPR